MGKPTDLVQGTLDLLILKTLSLEAKHGWAIAKRIQQVSREALQIQQGSLYPALHRLEQQAGSRRNGPRPKPAAKPNSITLRGRAVPRWKGNWRAGTASRLQSIWWWGRPEMRVWKK